MLMVSTTCMTVMFCNDNGSGGNVYVMAYYCFLYGFALYFFFLLGDAIRFSRF